MSWAGQVGGSLCPMSRLVGSAELFAVAAFDALLATIAILDKTGQIIAVNRAWDRFAQDNTARPKDAATQPDGHAGNGLGTDYLAVCEATLGEDRDYALKIAADIRAVLKGEPEGETEYRCELADGVHYFLARVTGFVQDKERYAVVAHEDITRRKRAELEVLALNKTLEQRVHERSRQLEEQNAELKRIQQALEDNNHALIESNLQLNQFAHVASHDLQEPLRILGAYSDMLRHRYQHVLDGRGQGYLGHITEQVTRARQMVRDVLAFSSVSYRPERERLRPAELWRDAVQFLDWPADTTLNCEDLPEISATSPHMRQLLGNLLGNSLKFRSERPLEVTLGRQHGQQHDQQHDQQHGREVQPGYIGLVLRDNGVGIAPEYREQVFGMFQRLHSRTTSGGNGIGLAICRKIIELHGGRIWIEVGHPENAPGSQGVAVHFTLPLG